MSALASKRRKGENLKREERKSALKKARMQFKRNITGWNINARVEMCNGGRDCYLSMDF